MPVRPDKKPNFDFSLRPRSLQENDSVRLSCIASGYPEPKVVHMGELNLSPTHAHCENMTLKMTLKMCFSV